MRDYDDYVLALRATAPDLAAAVMDFHTLKNVLAWMRDRNLSLGSLDVIFQDEYSHDVLIPLAEDPRWLIFGIT
jgi:hypothetical protein